MESTQPESTQAGITVLGQTIIPIDVKIYPHGAIYLPKYIRKMLSLGASTLTLKGRLTFMPGKAILSVEIPAPIETPPTPPPSPTEAPSPPPSESTQGESTQGA